MSSGRQEPEVRETHCATVLLLGSQAYKIKKAVDLGFLDWRSPDSRRAACHREVELNRRFAPDVYEGVAEVHGPDGAACEWVVLMRRMPSEVCLTTLIEIGADVGGSLRDTARALARHHATARRSPRIDRAGMPEALEGRWLSNLHALRQLPSLADPTVVEEIAALALGYVAGRAGLLRSRVAAGLVRDGHGDLLADDIYCLPDGPRILDCLEFDDDLRAVDEVDDAACLAMDLERLGVPGLGRQFLSWFREFSGHPYPESLAHHYVAYRAVMRAKVAALRASQGAELALAQCRLLLGLGLQHLRAAEPTLILVGGLPGTGKSTLAAALADARGAVLLGSDRLRKELAGLDPAVSAASSWEAGIYDPAWTDRMYDELAHRAEELLGAGESVVLDATWARARHRLQAQGAADLARARLLQFHCVAPPEVAEQRLLGRRRQSEADPSDASVAVAAAMVDSFEPWPESEEISTTAAVPEVVRRALARLAY